MRIAIPFLPTTPAGGSQFIRLFRRWLEGNKIFHTSDPNSAVDILFLNSWQTQRPAVLYSLFHNPNLRIVHRIDGAAQDYGRADDADIHLAAINRLADISIFQSNYCHHSTQTKYPIVVRDGPIISNPVDLELFTPVPDPFAPTSPIKVACVTWSPNTMKGAAQIYQTAAANPSISFVLCGPYADAPALPNIERLGVLERQELAATLRSCQLMLTYSQNEACPNHVLEGLASGLPILHSNTGAMADGKPGS